MPELILIVDDHFDCAAPLAYLLQRFGYRAEYVRGAAEARAFLLEERPALIVLDNMMPGLSGLELLRELRSDSRTASIPVLMYTSGDGPDEMEQCRRLHADFVCKGRIEFRDLLHRIRRLAGSEALPTSSASTGTTQMISPPA